MCPPMFAESLFKAVMQFNVYLMRPQDVLILSLMNKKNAEAIMHQKMVSNLFTTFFENDQLKH